MSKPFSSTDLSAQLSRDLTWRIKEVSDLKSAIFSSDTVSRPALLRALVTVSYAHWEGHVRFSAQKYMAHIALRKFPYISLSRQFLRNEFLLKISLIGPKNIQEQGQLIDAILDSSDRRFSQAETRLINTKSNLNYKTLCDICYVCDIDPNIFSDHEKFIDEFLLKRRNAIAHGEETFVHIDDINSLVTNTIELMRMFSNDLESKALMEHYRSKT